jgi:hypothetical protein
LPEPDEGNLSCPVLRGEGGSNAPDLLDKGYGDQLNMKMYIYRLTLIESVFTKD